MANSIARKLLLFRLLLTCVLMLFSVNLICQEDAYNNSLYFEVGKNGLIYNVVFDKEIEMGRFGVRANVGSNLGQYLSSFKTGVGMYRLIGGRGRQLELGFETEYLNNTEISDDQKSTGNLVYPASSIKAILLSTNVGYRSKSNRGIFRIGVSPMYLQNNLFLGGYLSYGFRF